MIIKKSEFVTSAVKENQYPDTNIPEIAFAGRSNVGKSSILNALANRKSIARVGSRPGMTRLVNFFNINDQLHLVDLPGYGYAQGAKFEQRAWGKIVETYLNKRKQLKLIILLLDIRHKPSSDDLLMFDWIKSVKLPYLIVATKCDKIFLNRKTISL